MSTPRFARYLRQAPWGGLKIDLSAVRREKKLNGKWAIISNDDTLSAEDPALGYKQLMRVEQCWHTVKGGLRTRPIFHYTPHRICAHVSLCVLALLVERIAEIRAKDTWRNVRRPSVPYWKADVVRLAMYVGEGAMRPTPSSSNWFGRALTWPSNTACTPSSTGTC